MGRNKRYMEAHAPHEIPCYGIAVAYDEAVMSKLLSKDEKDIAEVQAYLGMLVAPTKDFDCVLGVNNGSSGILVLVRVMGDGSDKIAVQELLARYCGMGCKCQLAKEIVYADGRYLEEPYVGFIVAIPKHEIEVEIRRILDTYCHEWKVTQDPKIGMLYYDGDLGGKDVSICVQNGDWQMSAGLANSQTFYTSDVSKHWKNVLGSLEEDIINWSEQHPGLAKRVSKA